MATIQHFIAPDETALWKQVSDDLKEQPDLFEYEAILDQAGRKVNLIIENDPGGGFESGISFTRFQSVLDKDDEFKFAIHPEGFMAEVGKFFGMQDKVLGFPEFDKNLIVKTNNPDELTRIFSDPRLRSFFQSLKYYHLHIINKQVDGRKERLLVLEIDEGITDTGQLRNLYQVFMNVLQAL